MPSCSGSCTSRWGGGEQVHERSSTNRTVLQVVCDLQVLSIANAMSMRSLLTTCSSLHDLALYTGIAMAHDRPVAADSTHATRTVHGD